MSMKFGVNLKYLSLKTSFIYPIFNLEFANYVIKFFLLDYSQCTKRGLWK